MKLEDIREVVIEHDLSVLEAQGCENMDTELYFSTNDEVLAYHGPKRAEYLLRMDSLRYSSHKKLEEYKNDP